MTNLKWWQKAVFYQIYPRSFADSTGNGIGDLPGIISRLDYLKDLGIDAIWLSPHYPSPQFDCGYDISDYIGVDPEYGSMDDFRRFLDQAHRRDLRLIIDLVLNHTSDQHSWFLESRSSRMNPKRDWYIWKDGKNEGPPNNWYAIFGGSAWEYDPETGQYYYHFFFKEQPDLNWCNPEVKQAMFDAVRFWLDLGVDGFRLDAIGTIFEHPDFPDHDADITLIELNRLMSEAETEQEKEEADKIWRQLFQYQVYQPGLHEFLKDLRKVIDEYDDCVLVGETDELAYLGSGDDELHMVFNFPLMHTERLTPSFIQQNQEARLAELKQISPTAWPCNTLGNHDTPRIYNHYGDGKHNKQIARLSLALMLTLRGTPFLYNGEEIGMSDLILKDTTEFRDPMGIWLYKDEIKELGTSPEEALKRAAQFTRDKNRTPIQWSNAPNAGFSPEGVKTWLPVHPNYTEGVNVADQLADPGSLINFYRKLLRVRKENPSLINGEYHFIGDDRLQHAETPHNSILAFLRRSEEQTCLVVLNYSDLPHNLDLTKSSVMQMVLAPYEARLVFSSRQRTPLDHLESLDIDPFEIYIAQVDELPVSHS
jgi:alpha-glucosidase